MTGPVDWTMLLFMLSACIAGAGAAWWMATTLATTRRDLQDAFSQSMRDLREEYDSTLAQTDANHEHLAREFQEHKLHVAETYMSKMSGGTAIDRATQEMKSLRTEMKEDLIKLEQGVSARLDRLETRLLSGTSPNRT
jgi:hypothetical protein